MDIFDIHANVISEYESFVNSFINIKDETIRTKVEGELHGGDSKLWPEPLIQFNPSYKTGESVENLCNQGLFHKEISRIFKGFQLYKHQVDALKLGVNDKDFIVTSGTGSGKSLTYLGTIFNHVLHNSHKPGVKAIIVYPMNALINSQFEAIKGFKTKYEDEVSSYLVLNPFMASN